MAYCVVMRLIRVVQAGAIVGLSAVGAVFAHAGPAGIVDRRWLAAAAVGAVLALAALMVALWFAVTLWRSVVDVERALSAGPADVAEEIRFSALVGVMLACQACAHVALLSAGVSAHTGSSGSLALHLLLAIAGALVVALVGRIVGGAADAVAQAVARALALLLGARAARRAPCLHEPRLRPPAGGPRSRAPPVPLPSL